MLVGFVLHLCCWEISRTVDTRGENQKVSQFEQLADGDLTSEGGPSARQLSLSCALTTAFGLVCSCLPSELWPSTRRLMINFLEVFDDSDAD